MISTLEPASVEQEIARIVRDELLLGSDRPIPFDQPLGELGVGLDSLGLVNLLTAVETVRRRAVGRLLDRTWSALSQRGRRDRAEHGRLGSAHQARRPGVARVLHGRLEQIEDSSVTEVGRSCGLVRDSVPLPVKRFCGRGHGISCSSAASRIRRLRRPLRLRRSSCARSRPGEQPDLSDLWAPVHARRMTQRLSAGGRRRGDPARRLRRGSGVAVDFISGSAGSWTSRSTGRALASASCSPRRAPPAVAASGSRSPLLVQRRARARLSDAATHVWDGNTAMLAAATQLLGFRIVGSARRTAAGLGITRWTWEIAGTRAAGARLVL